MAHKKAGGSTSLGRDSRAQRLGVKVHAGKNVRRGGDDTIYALANGTVRFVTKKVAKFHGNLKTTKFVHVDKVAVK